MGAQVLLLVRYVLAGSGRCRGAPNFRTRALIKRPFIPDSVPKPASHLSECIGKATQTDPSAVWRKATSPIHDMSGLPFAVFVKLRLPPGVRAFAPTSGLNV